MVKSRPGATGTATARTPGANLPYSSVFLRKNNESSSALQKFLQFVRGKNGAASKKETG